jgi:hypothetical protein
LIHLSRHRFEQDPATGCRALAAMQCAGMALSLLAGWARITQKVMPEPLFKRCSPHEASGTVTSIALSQSQPLLAIRQA